MNNPNMQASHRKNASRLPLSQIPANESEWWLTWWNKDFSWEGLSRVRWRGWKINPENGAAVPAREAPNGWKQASLQDYWRIVGIEDDDLINIDGILFSPIHCPLKDENGNDTSKVNWSELVWSPIFDQLHELADNATETNFANHNSDEPDGRVQLHGAVLKNLPIRNYPWRICAPNSYIGLNTEWPKQSFGANSELTAAFLAGDVELSIPEESHAPILARTYIDGNLVLQRDLETPADQRTAIGVFLAEACVAGTLSAPRFHFNDFNCRGLVVKGNTSLFECRFSSTFDVTEAKLFGDVNFRGSKFLHIAQFTNACIGSDGEYASTISFIQTEFFGFATFEGASFHGDCNFRQAIFDDQVVFAKIKISSLRKFVFEGAEFKSQIKFSPLDMPEKLGVLDRAFIGAIMPTFIDCTDTEMFSAHSAFDGAKFDGRIDFNPATLRKDAGFREALRRAENKKQRSLINWIRKLIDADLKSLLVLTNLSRRYRNLKWITDKRDARLRSLEGGVRILKQGAEAGRDRLSEQRYYRYELMARRDNSQTPPWERALSKLFSAVSDYGASVDKPFYWLIRIYFLGAFFYFLTAAVVTNRVISLLTLDIRKPIDKSVFDALILSGETMLRPFFVWAPRRDPVDSIAAKLFESDITGVIVRLFASMQSFAAIILFFLIALAVRRRFQIN